MGAPVRLALGSMSPVKRAAVERIAPQLFSEWQLETLEVPSGVPRQPWGDEETARGAWERARQAQKLTGADYGIGIESGVVEGPLGRVYAVSWAVVVDRRARLGVGGAERFPLPDVAVERLRAGEELGRLLEMLAGNEETRPELGAVGALTGGRRNRVDLLAVAVLHAFMDLLKRS
ncbi:inosine/xanthosine triphosphatase [Thermomicrobiaceae bacterium CFH 74404]|uniref:inosine/xanthosine triphosphatase n=1 Tax=Thermalbibacter longus TaxID=2951981 RepID=A0AA41WDU9_9BACT|nr:inosine/xanthosine triphosphatase [Thermalbibacter longus]MCM8749288.1 inosine/xanthosine triphosphatase [Thermalbibacter longus]